MKNPPPSTQKLLTLSILPTNPPNNPVPLTLTLPRHTKISELNSLVQSKLHNKSSSEPFCLESQQGYDVLDYWLLQENRTLERVRNGQRLRIFKGKSEKRRCYQLEDFVLRRCLGKGGSCVVYLVRCRYTCKLYALKQIAKQSISQYKRFQQILRQRKILLTLPANPYTINCSCAFESPHHLNFLLQYCPGGQLFHHGHLHLNPQSSKLYFCEILTCMEFLFKNHIMYRDLKPENILVDGDGHIRVAADFGLSSTGGKGREKTTDGDGGSKESELQLEPEVLLENSYGYKLDMYALGVILYELVTGLPPFQSNEKLFQGISKKQLEYPPMDLKLKKVLQGLLMKEIGSVRQVKLEQWLEQVDWERVEKRRYTPPIELDLYGVYIREELGKEVRGVQERWREEGRLQEPLFQFFQFERTVMKTKKTPNFKKNNNISMRVATQNSAKDSVRSIKSSTHRIKKPSAALLKPIQNQPIANQPKNFTKKTTAQSVQRQQEQRNLTPKSHSLKKLTVLSSLSSLSKRSSGNYQLPISHEASSSKTTARNPNPPTTHPKPKPFNTNYRIILS